MAHGLGIVLTPYGKIPGGYPPAAIDYTYKGATEWYGSVAANEARFDKPGVYDPRLDPQFNARGEAGYYYDTALGRTVGVGCTKSLWQRMKDKILGAKPLGAIPTDFQLSTRYGYLPVMSGWIRTQQGYQTGPWLPPGGNPAWAGYPTPIAPLAGSALAGLRAVETTTESQPVATVDDVLGVLVSHNDRALALAIVSTTAVTVSALLGIFRTLKLIREEGK